VVVEVWEAAADTHPVLQAPLLLLWLRLRLLLMQRRLQLRSRLRLRLLGLLRRCILCLVIRGQEVNHLVPGLRCRRGGSRCLRRHCRGCRPAVTPTGGAGQRK
jgi:hypothetical protein